MHSSGADSIGANPLPHEVHSNRACYTDDCALTCPIGETAINGDHTGHRGNVDQYAALRLLCKHLHHCIFRTKKYPPGIHRHETHPILKGGLKNVANMTYASIIHQNIEPPVFLIHLREDILHL